MDWIWITFIAINTLLFGWSVWRLFLRGDKFSQAAARIDFADDAYMFIRAIDGDTIVVKPPPELQKWMRDVRIRLYGLETPELWEEFGQQYRQYLEQLCSIDADLRLHIVWERERLGTHYEGFPLASFERGIGHVFFQARNGKFLYINGLMHLLKHSTLYRKDKLLLRGKSVIPRFELVLPHTGTCRNTLPNGLRSVSDTYAHISSLKPPVCLLAFSDLPTLDPRDGSLTNTIVRSIQGNAAECPFAVYGRQFGMPSFAEAVRDQRMSPFDIPLQWISRWASHQSLPGETTETRVEVENETSNPRIPLSEDEHAELQKLESYVEWKFPLSREEKARLKELQKRRDT